MSIKNELSEMQGIQSVDGTPENKSVVVSWEAPASEKTIRAMLQEINYPAD
jgi:copper chaperone CopZ